MLNSGSSSTFPLNVDLMDRLLMTILNFHSLQNFILSSKSVYSIFRCRQNSILGAVAHNQLGAAFPQAMNLVRCLGGTHSPKLTHELYRELSSAQDCPITPAQARLLREHATIVQTLEDIYSWREKDPRSRSSKLSPAESLRFQQSMYKFWLLAAAYGPGALVDQRHEHDKSNYLQPKESIISKQMAFLLNLKATELIGVDEVHKFLLDLAKWTLVKYNTRPMRFGDEDDIYLVWSGPAVTLDAFRGKWPSSRIIDSQWYGTWRAMTHTFLSTEISSITGGSARLTTCQRFILDDHFLNTVDCSHCRGLHSMSRKNWLWSFFNWEYMILAISPSRLGGFLASEKRKPLELLVSVTEEIQSIPYSQVIEEIFDIRSKKYKDWRKDDWFCTRCMTVLLSDNIQAWFDERNAIVDVKW